MPDWTQEQQDQINDAYWLDQETIGPICGANVRVSESGVMGFPKHIFANCAGCGARATIKAAQERKEKFDEEQLKEFVGLSHRSRASTCPHDGTVLDIEEMRPIGAPNHYIITCPRCGISGQITWAPMTDDEQ